ncbi:MAG TPA: hypothetical protein PK090_11295 [Smithellaceae bacterium]|nr:hypothetical protein [Smithellaceae bacterium]
MTKTQAYIFRTSLTALGVFFIVFSAFCPAEGADARSAYSSLGAGMSNPHRSIWKMTAHASVSLFENISKSDYFMPFWRRKVTAGDLYRIMLPGLSRPVDWNGRLEITALSTRADSRVNQRERELSFASIPAVNPASAGPLAAANEEERPIFVPASHKQYYGSLISLSVPVFETASVCVKPTVSYSFAPDDAARRAIQKRGLSPDSFVYGGLHVFFSF